MNSTPLPPPPPPTPSGSPPPLGMADFFALEAGEYLERLDAVLQAPEGTSPAAEEFVRLSRALRGAALMASRQPIARAAAGLESLARAIREQRRSWDAGTRQIAIRAVDDLKIFIRTAANWTDADTAKAEALGSQLDQLAGRASAQIRAAEALGLDAGARAFIAREGAAIASSLDRAGQTMRANPAALDSATARTRRAERPAAAPRSPRGNRANRRRAGEDGDRPAHGGRFLPGGRRCDLEGGA